MNRLIKSEILFNNRAIDLLGLLVVAGVAFAHYAAFVLAPNEQTLGAVQRILYFHVGSATATYVMIAVMLGASIFYLVTKESLWDFVNDAASGIGIVFATIVLVTGMIWGHSSWNTWWRWEPRLVSFLVLWAILFSHRFIKWQEASAVFAAVVGVMAAVNVPIVVFSVKFLSQSEQLHPQVLAEQGLRSGWYVFSLLFSTFSLLFFAFWLMVLKTSNILLVCKLRDWIRKHG